MEDETVKKVLELSKINSLNPMQNLALKKGLLDGKNLVVAAPTASGKTLLCELAALNLFKNKKSKMIYIAPLVALVSEKYESFKQKYSKLGVRVAMSVGDYDSTSQWLADYDWILTSNEKCDSLMRHNVDWIRDVGLIVVDEIHMLQDPSRGPTLEVTLTRLRETVPHAQILALSATIQNVKELGEWLDAETVISDYRPVELHEGIYLDSKIQFFGRDSYELNPILDPEPAILQNTINMKKQALYFVATRKYTESLAENLGRFNQNFLERNEKRELAKLSDEVRSVLEIPTKQCRKLADCVKNGIAFHHAGLLYKQKKMIEDNFKKGLLRSLVATPTLCLHPNTLIPLADGRIVRIEDINPKDEVVSLNFNNLLFEKRKVLGKRKRNLNLSEKLLELTTSSNKKLLLTPNHPLLTINDGKLSWTPIVNLKTNDYIAFSNEIPTFNEYNINILDLIPDNCRVVNGSKILQEITDEFSKSTLTKELASKYDVKLKTFWLYRGKRGTSVKLSLLKKMALDVNWNSEKLLRKIDYVSFGNEKSKIKIPKNLPLLARFYGIIVGDGNLLKVESFGNSFTYLISLTSTNKKWLSQYKILIKTLFDIDAEIKKHCKFEEWYVSFKSKIVGHILQKLGVPAGKKSNIVEITPVLMRNSKLLREVIIALFDCEGSINLTNRSIEMCSASKRLIEQLQLLLLRFGIFSSVDEREPRKTKLAEFKNKNYRVRITGPDVKKFTNKLGFKHLDQKLKSRRIKDTNTTFHRDIIPYSGDFIKNIIKESSISIRKFRKLTGFDYFNYEIKKQNLLRESANKLAKIFNPSSNTASFLKKLVNSHSRWEKIKKIQECNEKTEVYDLTIERSHNFVADGFIVHNSYGVNLPAFRVIIRDIKRYYSGFGARFIPVLEYKQFCGRAGRPTWDTWGESILIAKSEDEAHELTDKYILGEPEEIYSKLAFEPILRMHTLALIASGFVKNEDSLMKFFEKTFFAYQYGDISEINEKLESILEMLVDFGFIIRKDEKLIPTKIGKRVSELYIDPFTAHHIIKCLERAMKIQPDTFSYLHMITDTLEMKPFLSVSNKEFEEISNIIATKKFLTKIPNDDDLEFDDFLKSIKTTLILQNWIDESTEDQMLVRFKVMPGDLWTRLRNTDWLLYASQELALLLGYKKLLGGLRKIRVRVKYGVKEELIPLVRLQQIGRIRARKLYNAGLKTISDLKKIPLSSLERIAGPKVAAIIKKQLGEKVELIKEEKQTILKPI